MEDISWYFLRPFSLSHTTSGLTPASEELQKLQGEGATVSSGGHDVMADPTPIKEEEIYEEIDSEDLGLD